MNTKPMHTPTCEACEVGICLEDHVEAIPTITIVPESASHVAFVNGKTYSRKQIEAYPDLLASLKEYKETATNGTVITLGMARRSQDVIARAEGKE
jgi:hypothetical protein